MMQISCRRDTMLSISQASKRSTWPLFCWLSYHLPAAFDTFRISDLNSNSNINSVQQISKGYIQVVGMTPKKKPKKPISQKGLCKISWSEIWLSKYELISWSCKEPVLSDWPVIRYLGLFSNPGWCGEGNDHQGFNII